MSDPVGLVDDVCILAWPLMSGNPWGEWAEEGPNWISCAGWRTACRVRAGGGRLAAATAILSRGDGSPDQVE